ncbi:MAG: hydrogenase nickel incorporation protein HypB [Candidatus Omnitrophica bacterium]|nr:hydrogenase nickel incorporation protein HypB [Candidatus Omnitrophota bacterium]
MGFKTIEQNIMRHNDDAAAEVRALLEQKRVFAVNIISSPGAGKTALLENVCPVLKKDNIRFMVVTGDCFTSRDAERIDKLDLPVVQVTTGGACHMNAQIVGRVLEEQDLEKLDLLIVENLGNLVCPAGFDLGEDVKVALFSTAEGEDKPLKYPMLVKEGGLAIINKTDLLEHLDFDMDFCENSIKKINPGIRMIRTSCVTGQGIEELSGWLKQNIKMKKERNR